VIGPASENSSRSGAVLLRGHAVRQSRWKRACERLNTHRAKQNSWVEDLGPISEPLSGVVRQSGHTRTGASPEKTVTSEAASASSD